jgi:hypothetical protein
MYQGFGTIRLFLHDDSLQTYICTATIGETDPSKRKRNTDDACQKPMIMMRLGIMGTFYLLIANFFSTLKTK